MQPVTSTSTAPIDLADIPAVTLTNERFKASFGPKTPVTVSGGDSDAGPAVYILTPHMAAPAGVGFMHSLSQGEAAELIAALYGSLTSAGKLQAVAALGKSNQEG